MALELARKAADVFRERGLESARLQAELLLAWILGLERLDLYLQYDRPVTEAELAAFRAAVRRRLRHEPLQYIVGEVAFRGLTLRVDRRVLIPRPETEVLAGEVLAWAQQRSDAGGSGLAASGRLRSGTESRGRRTGDGESGSAASGALRGSAESAVGRLTALDVGTGSGALAIVLAAEGGFASVVATDVSQGALEVAAENALRAGVSDRIEFRLGDLWSPIAASERFDVVVSNPPYVPERERATLAPEVRDWEPAEALFAGEDGLRVVDALVAGAPDRLRPGGLLALELGLGQAAVVAGRVRSTAGYVDVRVVRDLANRERIMLAIMQ
jgi:release factor glutamine methyltransferase